MAQAAVQQISAKVHRAQAYPVRAPVAPRQGCGSLLVHTQRNRSAECTRTAATAEAATASPPAGVVDWYVRFKSRLYLLMLNAVTSKDTVQESKDLLSALQATRLPHCHQVCCPLELHSALQHFVHLQTMLACLHNSLDNMLRNRVPVLTGT